MIQIKEENQIIGKVVKSITSSGGDLVIVFTDDSYTVFHCITPDDNEIELCKSNYEI